MPTTPDEIVRARIVELARQADQTHLAIGRLLAEAFYNNDRAAYESRAPKDMSLRRLERHLRTNYDIPRCFSSLRQMLAAHFQEPDLRLTEAEAHALSWRSRVELLRVHAPDKKAEWAHKAITEKLSSRKLSRLLTDDQNPPLVPPRTPRQRALRIAKNMEKVLSLWKEAPPEAAQTLRQLRTNLLNARLCTHAKAPQTLPAMAVANPKCPSPTYHLPSTICSATTYSST